MPSRAIWSASLRPPARTLAAEPSDELIPGRPPPAPDAGALPRFPPCRRHARVGLGPCASGFRLRSLPTFHKPEHFKVKTMQLTVPWPPVRRRRLAWQSPRPPTPWTSAGPRAGPSHSWNKAAEGFAAEVKERPPAASTSSCSPAASWVMKDHARGPADRQPGRGHHRLRARCSRSNRSSASSSCPTPGPPRSRPTRPTTANWARRWPKLAEKNLVIVSWWENGFRHPDQQSRPGQHAGRPERPEDAVTPDKMRLDTFTALGANPRRWPSASLYSALQRKVFDAQETRCRSSTPRRSSRSRSICR